ncbi:hypothetical protein Btru_040814 [Bulinus truncatus]|nr:hypothetical protein Btru_040814 [Bulinus truncatus]
MAQVEDMVILDVGESVWVSCVAVLQDIQSPIDWLFSLTLRVIGTRKAMRKFFFCVKSHGKCRHSSHGIPEVVVVHKARCMTVETTEDYSECRACISSSVCERNVGNIQEPRLCERNRLADMAKTKRINRNFCDIVEKAKWLKEMKDSGLTDDDTLSSPNIIEIPLKELTVNVELGASCLKLDSIGSPLTSKKVAEAKVPSSDESSSAESDDSLLGASRGASNRSLPNTLVTGRELALSMPSSSAGGSSRRSQKAREEYRRRRCKKYSTASSPDLDMSPNLYFEGVDECENDAGRHRSFSVDGTCPSLVGLDSPPNNTRDRLSPGSALPSASFVNELSPPCRSKHQKCHLPRGADRIRFSKSNQKEASIGDPPYNADRLTGVPDSPPEDGTPRHTGQLASALDVHSNLLKQKTDDLHNLVDKSACSSYSQKALLPKTSNISLSLLHKTRSYQDHLCSLAECSNAEASPYLFSLDTVTKEELLVLWKSSEIELNRRLETALREKAKLERRLALLQKHSPV